MIELKVGGQGMRRRLKSCLPFVLIAILVQIYAPIGATWAATIAAADPLRAAPICHGGTTADPARSDPSGQPRAHEGCCSICSVVGSAAPIDTPQASFAAPTRPAARIIWREAAPDLFSSRAGSRPRARAPPTFS